jgi:hypothetical protein
MSKTKVTFEQFLTKKITTFLDQQLTGDFTQAIDRIFQTSRESIMLSALGLERDSWDHNKLHFKNNGDRNNSLLWRHLQSYIEDDAVDKLAKDIATNAESLSAKEQRSLHSKFKEAYLDALLERVQALAVEKAKQDAESMFEQVYQNYIRSFTTAEVKFSKLDESEE